MASLFKKDRSKIRSIKKYMLMMIEKEYIMQYIAMQNQIIGMCKQFVWMGNVSKITCKWF